mgnify:CR=1 FL=1
MLSEEYIWPFIEGNECLDSPSQLYMCPGTQTCARSLKWLFVLYQELAKTLLNN